MKRYFIRITALVLCCLLIVQISAATPITTEVVDLDNLAQVNAFVESGRIFDFLYYSSTELALFMMSIRHSDFAALCENRATITSLHYLIASEGDELTNHLLSIWCTYLEGKFGIATPSTLSHSENKPCSKCQTYCIDYTLEVPSGETIDALKYTGPSETPTRNDMSSYPSAVQLYSSSHSYNCHSFAWYLHGNPYSKMQLKFETPDGFIKNGSCAQRVSTPRELLIKSALPYRFRVWYNNTIKAMVVHGNEAGNIYRYGIQLPQKEDQAGEISGDHGRNHSLG